MKQVVCLIFLTILYSCHTRDFEITAFDEELNQDLISQKNIDHNLFGSNRSVQYFKVSGSSGLSPEEIKSKILAFTQDISPESFSPKTTEINLLFYQARLRDYSRAQLYKAAMETELGMLEGERDNLTALIRLSRSIDGGWVRIYDGYAKKEKTLHTIDTLATIKSRPQSEIASVPDFSAKVDKGNCLKVLSPDSLLSIDNCYQVDFLEIRSANKQKLSLTFISGKNALDVDFYPTRSGWVSKKVCFFGATTKNKRGINQIRVINLKQFDFSFAAGNLL